MLCKTSRAARSTSRLMQVKMQFTPIFHGGLRLSMRCDAKATVSGKMSFQHGARDSKNVSLLKLTSRESSAMFGADEISQQQQRPDR
jgi:hypothetical protein